MVNGTAGLASLAPAITSYIGEDNNGQFATTLSFGLSNMILSIYTSTSALVINNKKQELDKMVVGSSIIKIIHSIEGCKYMFEDVLAIESIEIKRKLILTAFTYMNSIGSKERISILKMDFNMDREIRNNSWKNRLKLPE